MAPRKKKSKLVGTKDNKTNSKNSGAAATSNDPLTTANDSVVTANDSVMTSAQAIFKVAFPSGRGEKIPPIVFGVDTRSFAYNGPQPASNPELTVWALMNAIAYASFKGVNLVVGVRIAS